MTRDEIIALIVAKANEHGLVPWEFLGGAIAESGLNPNAWRQGAWPDWSAGLYQQTVLYAREGDHTSSEANVALIKRLYFDPAHSCDVAAEQFRYWRYDPEVSVLQAWCAYNLPASYKQWPNVSNVEQRENYRAGLEEAQRILGGAPMPTVTYNRTLPAIAQNDPWSCAPTSTRWALTTLGRNPAESWMEATMIADGVVSQADGLLDASGTQLARWITAQYGEFGFSASNENPVTFQFLAEEFRAPANPYPGMIGGRAWNHWVGLRSYDPARDLLLLANPSDGWMGVSQTMTRQQFQALGPFSLVRVLHPDLIGTPEPPPPPVDPQAGVREKLVAVEAAVAALRTELAL